MDARRDTLRMAHSTQRVILLHGIWNQSFWLVPLARKLRAHGFEPEIFAYDSILRGPQAAIPQLIERLQTGGPAHLLGHSLGGLMALETLAHTQNLPVERVVCLGSPLRGSEAARTLSNRAWMRPMLGRSASLLTRGFVSCPDTHQVGMVAGIRPRGLGQIVARFKDQSDGTVLVSETHLPGLTDHCTVDCGHTELAFLEEPAARAAQFLRNGCFDRAVA